MHFSLYLQYDSIDWNDHLIAIMGARGVGKTPLVLQHIKLHEDINKTLFVHADDNKLVLTINRQPIGEWFKEQWEKLRQGLRQTTEEPRKSRGFKL